MNETVHTRGGSRLMSQAKVFIPLVGFVLLAMVLAAGFSLKDPHLLPSAMIDQSLDPFELATLRDPERKVTNADLKGHISLLNVWATWCPNCIVEHPEMMRISREESVRLIGVNYNDDRDKAIKWLARRGDPYVFNIFDDQGRLGINLGVYGAPETYLVDTNGVVRYRHVGIMTREIFETEIKPRVEMLKDGQSETDPGRN